MGYKLCTLGGKKTRPPHHPSPALARALDTPLLSLGPWTGKVLFFPFRAGRI